MQSGTRVLGIEGGGTKTAWALVDPAGVDLKVLDDGKLPPSNFRLTTPDQLRMILRQLPAEVDRVGVFLAGCVTSEDRRDLATLAGEVWPRATIITGGDRDSGFAAAFGDRDGIAVNAGTGSSITGRRDGKMENAGGWGHILGDAGGGYYLSLQALRLVLRDYDLNRRQTDLTANVLSALCLNSLDDLVRWAQTADKMEIATLTPVIFAAAANGNWSVEEILRAGARVLAEYTHAVATRLESAAPEVKLLGGLFRARSIYVDAFCQELATLLPSACVEVAAQSPALGAAWLAGRPFDIERLPLAAESMSGSRGDGLATALTEQRNDRSSGLDRITAQQLVALFVDEEQFVQDALRAAVPELSRAIDLVVDALQNGGRLFYVGAGTSGRLGVLDASEIPPTFGTAPELVQGIIAGGAAALHRSVEGAEDAAGGGAIAVEQRGVGPADVICGITASGRTPFVLGALNRARRFGARTIFLTCNPRRSPNSVPFDVEIDLATGPEILTGSTRLKAGTATKIALNILTTGAMVRLGKVRDNLMIDVSISNAKLRDRATRILSELSRCDYATALERLERNGWNLPAAVESFL